ncbi:MAG: flavodoxin family protein [Candidatus Omnitrophica bacterium]|nr:flavodoxin family protein [Candidatus Omnitrophota bacterium]MDD5042308.1 flavodoxin family protein [Candidatus Omnitrophota bacterium]MDD5500467.1 flavodoxin family protein [Candidatus Omnitrophota bacterium]
MKAVTMKKILILNGSPVKNGNTAKFVAWFAQEARKEGASVKVVRAASLSSKVNGCISCRACQKSAKYECVFKDDVNDVLKEMQKADVIVFATPLYFYGPSAQLKLIIDRMFSLYKWDNKTDTFVSPMRGKSMGLILSAYEDIGLDIVEKSFKFIADYSEMNFSSFLVPDARESGEVEDIKGIRGRVKKFARGLKLHHTCRTL